MYEPTALLQVARAVLFDDQPSPERAMDLAEAGLAFPLCTQAADGETQVGVVAAPAVVDAVDGLQSLGEALAALGWQPDPSEFEARSQRFVDSLVVGRCPDGGDRLGVLLGVLVERLTEQRQTYRMLADVRWDPKPAPMGVEAVLALVKRRRECRAGRRAVDDGS